MPDLRWLRDPQAMLEPLPAVISDGILSVVSESTIHQIAANQSSSPALSSIAVNHHHILLRLRKELEHIQTCLMQQNKCGTVMILPVVMVNLEIEWTCIIFSPTQVYDLVVSIVLFL